MTEQNLERPDAGYAYVRNGIVDLLQSARVASARSINAIMTATYREIGRRIIESEMRGENRADYGEKLVEQLAKDLTRQFGRGFTCFLPEPLCRVDSLRRFVQQS